MSVRYWHPQDEDQVVGQPQTTFFSEEQNADWWVSSARSGQAFYTLWYTQQAQAQLTQAEIVVDLWQDDPAGSLVNTAPEEFYWLNLVYPVQGYLHQNLPLGIDDQTPFLFGQFDEDFWQNPAASVQNTKLAWPQQFSFDPDYVFVTPVALDEVFWSNPVFPALGLPFNTPSQWGFETGDLIFSIVQSIATDVFTESDTVVIAYSTLQTSLFPDTILLDIASDPTYPVPYQRGAIRVLLSRQANGREPLQYVTPQQAALRTASITALFVLRSSENPIFASLLAQEQAIFALTGL